MLKQLASLSVEADGRFATADELQFLKDYLATTAQRISAYEAIRDAEEKILDEVETKARQVNSDIFNVGGFDTRDLFIRDRKFILQWSAATMLVGDLDRLRDGLLLWHQTIMKGVKQEYASQVVSQVFPQAIAQVLPPETAELLEPSLSLGQTILG